MVIEIYLEHVGPHRVIELVLKTFILKVEFDDVVTVSFFNDGKENLNCSLGDRFDRMGLAEFDFIATRRGEKLSFTCRCLRIC